MTQTKPDSAKLRMFRIASAACGAEWPEHAGCYRCPLCDRVFSEAEIDALSLDHAPPESLPKRIRVIVLTCRECNSGAGESVDDAMLDQEELRALKTMTMWRPRRGIINTRDGPLAASAQFGPDGIAIFGAPKANRDETHKAWVKGIESGVGNGATPISISGSFEPRRPQRWAEIGWLRAAYLIAFASGGYRYTHSAALDVVRQQLQPANRDAVLIEKFAWRLTDAGVESGEVAYMDEPETFRSIAVTMGDVIVLLPVMDDPDLYTRLATESTDLRTIDGRKQVVPWPRPATYGMAARNI